MKGLFSAAVQERAGLGHWELSPARWRAWWRLAASDRRLIARAACLIVILLLGSTCAWWWQSSALSATRQSVANAQREHAIEQQRAADAARAAASAPASWWTELPADTRSERSPAEQLSADALMLAPRLGIQVLRMSMSPLPVTAAAPYHSTAVQVEVHGAYPNMKRWLGELLARRPHTLVVRSLDLRRAANAAAPSGLVEGSIELRLFERAGSMNTQQ